MKSKMKKYAAATVAMTMLLPGTAMASETASQTSQPAAKSDIAGHWAEKEFAEWAASGLVNGYGEGQYKPDQTITRAEFATLVNRAFRFTAAGSATFADLKESDFFYKEIMKAFAAGYLEGDDQGRVRPNATMTRAEAAAMLARVFSLQAGSDKAVSFKDAAALPAWSQSAVQALAGEGYIKGFPDGTFKPANLLSRAEAVVMLRELAGSVLNTAGEFGELDTRNAVISQDGVTLRDTTVKGNLYITEGVGDGDVTLDNVKVEGEVYVTGGGEHTVTLEDASIESLNVGKADGKIRIASKGGTSVDSTKLSSGAKLEEEGTQAKGGFKSVELGPLLPEKSSVQFSGEFEQVKVLSQSSPNLDLASGRINKLVLDGAAALSIGENAAINGLEINVDKEIAVTGKGKIESTDKRVVRKDENGTPVVPPTTTSTGTSAPTPTTPAGPTFGNVSVHDPSVIKNGNTYYVFGSHIEAAKSTDLLNWTTFTNGYTTPNNVVFGDLSSNLAGSFKWAGENDADSKGGFAVWAPDVYWNEDYVHADGSKGAYMLYYSASSTYIRSAIGLAVSKTIEGPYIYADTLVYSGFTRDSAKDANSNVDKKWDNTNIKSLIDAQKLDGENANWFNADGTFNNKDYPNAIDATILKDAEGKLWMTYGSWSGGIFLLEIDPATGKAIYPKTDGVTADGRMIDRYFGTKIAGGYFKSGEGPFIVYDEATKYYYLNVTYGWLGATGGYNMRQFRSANPDGPYVDTDEQPAVLPDDRTDNAAYGAKMIGNFQFMREIGDPDLGLGYGYVSSGHNSVYYDETAGKYFLFFHTRFPQKGEFHELRVHQMFMNKDGWLVVAPTRYTGEKAQTVSEQLIPGDYKFVNHGLTYSGDIANSVDIRLNADHTLSGAVQGTWELKDGYRATITAGKVSYEGVFVRGWDEFQQRETMTFTAISGEGVSAWGIQQPSISDNQLVANVTSALTLGDTSHVMDNVALPAVGARGAEIAWATSDDSVIEANGVIHQPAEGAATVNATLTATIKKGEKTATKTFQVTVAPYDPNYRLSAHYAFEDNLKDAAGKSADGTMTGNRLDNTGGTITYAEGVSGQAAVFDGSAGVKLPAGLISGNKYTVSMWLNPKAYTQHTTTFFGGTTSNWLSLVPSAWDNNTMLWSGSSPYIDGTTKSRIPLNEWHHVAFTVDSGALKVYVDGVQKYEGTGFPNLFSANAASFGLGVNFWDTPYQGMIDELYVFKEALSAERIAELATKPAAQGE
ncbi:S-layer homology domain-containing protein [Paenibacillus methanolicus]|uniref:Beta-xylosidase n=1 Tax=Paenibacillus methanolicus TaxID=582686 RepID=A0A5S5CJ28_9BACL|nr:S-layer homology domain-containing protein [Paenibacillus methanolicus]TYP79750.1 beta-xylosidase [Paenibacillus methanolicus]